LLDAVFDEGVFLGFTVFELFLEVPQTLGGFVDLELADLLHDAELFKENLAEFAASLFFGFGGDISAVELAGEAHRPVAEGVVLDLEVEELRVATLEFFKPAHGVAGIADDLVEAGGVFFLKGEGLFVKIGLRGFEEVHDAGDFFFALGVFLGGGSRGRLGGDLGSEHHLRIVGEQGHRRGERKEGGPGEQVKDVQTNGMFFHGTTRE